MSKDCSASSDQLTCKVISKYFSPEPVMDESLLDFQDKKTTYAGPKNAQKPKVVKRKPKKRIIGQKDIRTLVKSRQNELVSYATDFDNICKQSGLDVDSEQLQLAIALSKSLQDAESVSIETSEEPKVLTVQERTKKIKITLQEYGFKVPVIKKSTNVNKRKKYKKHYKLLQITESERQQIISDKYAEVLLRNNCETNNIQHDNLNCDLYYKTTNILYESIKDDEVFYCTNIFQKPLHKSCLLRDWSEIPGRLASPKQEVVNFNIDDITFTQNELDCLLSGSMKAIQQIVKKKIVTVTYDNCVVEPEDVTLTTNQNRTNILVPIKLFGLESNIEMNHVNDKCNLLNNLTCGSLNMLSVPYQTRSMSPDLFDDDEPNMLEETIDLQHTVDNVYKTTNDKTEMDLTECVAPVSNKVHIDRQPNETKSLHVETIRNSNDFMEITDCISTKLTQPSVSSIDLTQNFDNYDNCMQPIQEECVEIMDLTQSSNSNDDLPEVQISGRDKEISHEDTIIVNYNYSDLNNSTGVVEKQSRLKHSQGNYSTNGTSDCIDNRSTITCVTEYNNTPNLLCNENSNKSNVTDISLHSLNNSLVIERNSENNTPSINLTQSSESSNEDLENDSVHTDKDMQVLNDVNGLGKINQVSIDYDELYDNMFVNENIVTDTSRSLNNEISRESEDIIKTNEESNDGLKVEPNDKDYYSPIKNNLDNFDFGRISVMDDISNIEASARTSSTNLNNFNCDITLHRATDGNMNNTPNIIRNKELHKVKGDITPFKLNDVSKVVEQTPKTIVTPLLDYASITSPERTRELEKYGIKPFNQDNFNFGGISVMDDISDMEASARTSSTNLNNFNGDITLHRVSERNMNNAPNIIKDKGDITPPKLNNISKIVEQTPKTNEFLIKTNDVTPLLDYASMTSPERNRELEKYGLKPFKRKRAIQLLTYIYNQTHPIIECAIDEPSTSKAQKRDCDDVPQTSQNPSPRKVTAIDNIHQDKENIYVETKLQPDVRDIECSSEDWVFQKREKAKVHSCRVPLQIAFHNYVSCRRLLQEAILCYEPINIDVIHKDLVACGYRYNPKDLLKFLDKKCITVKTTDSTRNKRL